MEEETVPGNDGITPLCVGNGLAFLGMLLFLFNILFYMLSRGQPEMFHLFAGIDHMIIMSTITLVLVAVGYAITRIGPKSAE
jgi:hypothetical protein